MLYILDSMEEIKMRLLTDDYGKHLMGVEDLLQKHALVEADINVLGERVKVRDIAIFIFIYFSKEKKEGSICIYLSRRAETHLFFLPCFFSCGFDFYSVE